MAGEDQRDQNGNWEGVEEIGIMAEEVGNILGEEWRVEEEAGRIVQVVPSRSAEEWQEVGQDRRTAQ